jgi:hypothetical protein
MENNRRRRNSDEKKGKLGLKKLQRRRRNKIRS